MAETTVQPRVYFLVFAALIVLTVVTALVSFVDLGEWSGFVALLIAGSKASLVALFFMHLRYEKSKIVWVWGLAGIFWLGILMVLSLSDYATRGFLRVPGK